MLYMVYHSQFVYNHLKKGNESSACSECLLLSLSHFHNECLPKVNYISTDIIHPFEHACRKIPDKMRHSILKLLLIVLTFYLPVRVKILDLYIHY